MMHDRDRWSLTDTSLDSLPNELPYEALEVGAPSTCRMYIRDYYCGYCRSSRASRPVMEWNV